LYLSSENETSSQMIRNKINDEAYSEKYMLPDPGFKPTHSKKEAVTISKSPAKKARKFFCI